MADYCYILPGVLAFSHRSQTSPSFVPVTKVQSNAAFSSHIKSQISWNLSQCSSAAEAGDDHVVRDGRSQSQLSHPSLFKAWLPDNRGKHIPARQHSHNVYQSHKQIQIWSWTFSCKVMAGTLWLFSTRSVMSWHFCGNETFSASTESDKV